MGFKDWPSWVKWGIAGAIIGLLVAIAFYLPASGEGNGRLVFIFFMFPIGFSLFKAGTPLALAIFLNILFVFVVIGVAISLLKKLLKNKAQWLKGMIIADVIFLIPDLTVGAMVLLSYPDGPLSIGFFLISSAIILIIVSALGAIIGKRKEQNNIQ